LPPATPFAGIDAALLAGHRPATAVEEAIDRVEGEAICLSN
jgi:hypothetical protein